MLVAHCTQDQAGETPDFLQEEELQYYSEMSQLGL